MSSKATHLGTRNWYWAVSAVIAIGLTLAALVATIPVDASTQSVPTSNGGVTPYIVDDAAGGGNVTCEQLGFDFSSGRINYNGSFDNAFPDGLSVNVTDDTYVSWTSAFPIGAVIVKGGDAANVYDYRPEGSLGDSGLASPITSSGEPAELSNLTLCWNNVEETPTPTETEEPTATPTETVEPTVTTTETEEPTVTPTETEEPTVTPTETEEPTATPTETEEPTATPTETEEPTVTPTQTEVPTATPTETPTETPTATPTEVVEPTPTDETLPIEETPTATPAEATPTPTEEEPTLSPTDEVPSPTATPQDETLPTEETPTATPPVAQVLPVTGGGPEDTGWASTMFLAGMGLVLAGFGLIAHRRVMKA